MQRRNAAPAVAALACLALAGCALVGPRPEASCAAPMIEVEPRRAAPGGTFRVRGEAFGTCDDTGPLLDASKPMRNIRLILRRGSWEREVATVDADRRLSFDARLRVPAESEPGRACVVAAGAPEASAGCFLVLGEGPGSE